MLHITSGNKISIFKLFTAMHLQERVVIVNPEGKDWPIIGSSCYLISMTYIESNKYQIALVEKDDLGEIMARWGVDVEVY